MISYLKRITHTTIYVIALMMSIITIKAQAQDRPNVIIILNDDMGYADLGCYGAPKIKTPNVDKLASQGMKFTDFYVASPVCSASRAALLTGSYPYRVGVRGVFFPNTGHKGLSPKHVTIAETLKTVGYKTKAVGKWHLGDHVDFLPTNQGFDSYYGIPYSNDMYPAKDMKYADDCLYREGVTQDVLADAFANPNKGRNPKSMKNKVPLVRNEECVEFPVDQRTITKRFATESIEFISESVKEEKPFFLYLANPMPHIPLYVSPEFEGKSEAGLYGDVIEEIDYNTGRVLDHLEKLNIADNTIVIFTSDNGPWLVKGDQAGSALPLFEGKMTCFEGGQRVPAIIRWPNSVPAGSVCSELASTMDLLPTLAHITGAELKPYQPIDGKNITDLVTGKDGALTSYENFFYVNNAVRSGDWKYHAKEIFKVKKTARPSSGPTLYNLKEDIGESKNVLKNYPEVAERLKKALDQHKKYISSGK